MVEVEVRPARSEDAPEVADVYLASFAATYAFPRPHSDAETRGWIAEVLLVTREVWVATAGPGESVVAMMALTDDMIDQLYVAPGWTGRGSGAASSVLHSHADRMDSTSTPSRSTSARGGSTSATAS